MRKGRSGRRICGGPDEGRGSWDAAAESRRGREEGQHGEGITGDELLEFVNNDLFKALKNLLASGANAELAGVVRGVFVVKNRKRGIGRNPKRPQEEVVIPPGLTIRFKPGKELRNMVVEGQPEATSVAG